MESITTLRHPPDRKRRRVVLVAVLSLAAGGLIAGHALRDPIRGPAWLDLGFASPEAQVYRAWNRYFESKGGDLQGTADLPSAFWAPDELAKWPLCDLAGAYVPAGAIPTMRQVVPIAGTEKDDYEIVVDFLNIPFGGNPPQVGIPLTATWRVTRRGDRWLIANVLPERTRAWHTETIGQVTYHVEPGLTFDPTRASRAVAFIDSLADAFGVPRLGPLDYYVTSSVDAADHALGLDSPTHFGPAGGFAKPVDRLLFSGIPAWGEEYRHELAHLVLQPLIRMSPVTVLASEGIATWLGGSGGNDFPAVVGQLRDYLNAHPGVGLDSTIAHGRVPQAEFYASGAVLCEMLYRRGGVPALKAFLAAGPGTDQVRTTLVRSLGEPWERIAVDWRRTVDRVASPRGVRPLSNAPALLKGSPP